MNTALTIFILICIVSAGIAALFYIRTALPVATRIILISLRSLATGLIIIAFFEPIIHFERILSNDMPIPVLIDNSKSMQAFRNGNSVDNALTSLKKAQSLQKGKSHFIFYTFGDTLLKQSDSIKTSYNDHRSYFPFSSRDLSLQKAKELFLITDGNWSNTVIQRDMFENREVYYLALPNAYPGSSLSMNLPSEQIRLRSDSLTQIPLKLHGYFSSKEDLKITISEKNKILSSKSIKTDSGFFTDTILMQPGQSLPGHHLFRFEATAKNDSLSTTRYLIGNTIPGTFTYKIHAPIPSLERRFLNLTLNSHPELVPQQNSDEKVDLLIVLDPGNIESLTKSLKPTGVIIFLGCTPDSRVPFRTDIRYDDIKVVSPQDAGVINSIDFNSVPPPTGILKNESKLFVNAHTIIAAVNEANQKAASVPLMQTGHYRSYTSIVLPATDLWRWDFWPIGLDRATDKPFQFTEKIIEFTKDMLSNNVSNDFFVAPQQSPSEIDSVRFHLFFPSSFTTGSPVTIHFTIQQSSIVRDTTLEIIPNFSSRTTLTLGTLNSGRYKFSATATSISKKISYEDSLIVESDRSEFLTSGQNSNFLSEIGQPLSMNNDSLIHVFLDSRKTALPGNNTIKDSFQLRRSWPLLILVLILFIGEWFFRRRLRLDD